MERYTFCLIWAVLLVACARQGTAEPGGAPETKLEVRVWAQGEGQGTPRVYTIVCDPPSGDHPDVEAACATLQTLGAKAFAPVPPDRMCTQQYGGPMEARVRGLVAGQKIDARLSYTDGCQISRWDRLAPVVPLPRPRRDLR